MSDETDPSHEYLTVRELAALLRLKERKVYDLAASGAVPCTRATGKLLFPASEIRAWIGQGTARVQGRASLSALRPSIVLGSHDPLLDWAIRESGCGLATYVDGSLDGLDRFVAGEGMAAGLHVYDPARDSWNIPTVAARASGQNAVLMAFATRRRGLVFRRGDCAPGGIADLGGMTMVPRQPSSGTDILFRHLAEAAGLDLSALTVANVARTEDDAVEEVRRGKADVAFGLEAGARAFGLEFQPVIEEHFALLVDRRAWFEPPLQTLAAFCASPAFHARAKTLGGYDVRDFGTVLWNA